MVIRVHHSKETRPGLYIRESLISSGTLSALEALVVTIGPDGRPLLHSTNDFAEKNEPLPPSTYVAVVLDPRSVTNELLTPFCTSGTTVGNKGDVNFLGATAQSQWNQLMAYCLMAGKKVVPFVLLPSTTSSKSSLLCSEVGLYSALCQFHSMFLKSCGTYKPCFIRTDDYYHNDGNAIIAAMLQEGKRVYPKSEAQNMKELIFEHAKHTFEHSEKGWMHHLHNKGKKDTDISVALGILEPVEGEGKIMGVAKEFQGIFEDHGLHLDDIEATVLRKFLASDVDLDEEVEPSRPINSTSVKETFICFTEESQTKLKFADIDAKLFTPKDAIQEADVLQLKFADRIFEKDQEEGNNNIVVVAFPGDIRFKSGERSSLHTFMTLHKNLAPGKDLIVVFCHDSAEHMADDPYMVPAIDQTSKYADLVIFTIFQEMKDVQDIFKKAISNEAAFNMNVGRTLKEQLVPRQELHFFCLHTMLGGKELEDGEIIVPAVTVGPLVGSTLLPPKQKFNVNGKYFMQGFDNYERVVPGMFEKHGFEGVSLIAPAKFISKMMKKLLAKLDSTKNIVDGMNLVNCRVRLEAYIGLVEQIMSEAPPPTPSLEGEPNGTAEEKKETEGGTKEDEVAPAAPAEIAEAAST